MTEIVHTGYAGCGTPLLGCRRYRTNPMAVVPQRKGRTAREGFSLNSKKSGFRSMGFFLDRTARINMIGLRLSIINRH
jgi:hypothetical protein